MILNSDLSDGPNSIQENNDVAPQPEITCLDTIFSSRVHRRLSLVSFRARDAKSDVHNQVKTTKCVNSSTLTKINLLVMQWRVKYGEPINESQAQVKVRDWFSYLVEIIVGHCLL